MARNNQHKELYKLLKEIRNFSMPQWVLWKMEKGRENPEEMPSRGMCRFSAIFIKEILSARTGNEWRICGGGDQTGGMKNTNGEWCGHYWLQNRDKDILADITSDQFGWDEIIITDPYDARYNNNFSEEQLKDHLSHARVTPRKWLTEWGESKPERAVDLLKRVTLRAGLLFAYGNQKRGDVFSKTTFDAVLCGERTSTTRFLSWKGADMWAKIKPGEFVQFIADKNNQDRHCIVEIGKVTPIDLATCPDPVLEMWSIKEGWSPQKGRKLGEENGKALWFHHNLVFPRLTKKPEPPSLSKQLSLF